MKETFFSESTEKDAKTSARVLLFCTTGPLVTGAGVVAGGAIGWAALVAFFALSSSAHDFGAAGLGFPSALGAASSVVEAVAASSICDNSG